MLNVILGAHRIRLPTATTAKQRRNTTDNTRNKPLLQLDQATMELPPGRQSGGICYPALPGEAGSTKKVREQTKKREKKLQKFNENKKCTGRSEKKYEEKRKYENNKKVPKKTKKRNRTNKMKETKKAKKNEIGTAKKYSN